MIKLYNNDCLDIIPSIADNSIDMILCDLPYRTTGEACKNLNRKFIGIEKDVEYFNIAKSRILRS